MDNEKSQSVTSDPQLEQTDLAPDTPLTVEGDGPNGGPVAQALLARKKPAIPTLPTDCSRFNEEIAMLFIGDAAACVAAAGAEMARSGDTLFGPACGRSGNDVEVIGFAADGQKTEHGRFALACHYSSPRVNGRLQVNRVMLASRDKSQWNHEFLLSFFANCGSDDPGGA